MGAPQAAAYGLALAVGEAAGEGWVIGGAVTGALPPQAAIPVSSTPASQRRKGRLSKNAISGMQSPKKTVWSRPDTSGGRTNPVVSGRERSVCRTRRPAALNGAAGSDHRHDQDVGPLGAAVGPAAELAAQDGGRVARPQPEGVGAE